MEDCQNDANQHHSSLFFSHILGILFNIFNPRISNFSDYDDIYSAVPIAQSIGGNMIVVGVGNNTNGTALGYLSGNVLNPPHLSSDITMKINGEMCSPSTPHVTMPPATTPVMTTTAPVTSKLLEFYKINFHKLISAQPPAYNPQDADIVFLLDVSNSLNEASLQLEKNLIAQMTLNWNHWERTALFTYAGKDNFTKVVDYGEGTNYKDFMNKIVGLQIIDANASITSALTNLNSTANPTKIQRVIFITSTR